MCRDAGTKKQGPLLRIPASTAIYATILFSVFNKSRSGSRSADPVKGTRADKGELRNIATRCDAVINMCHVPVPPLDFSSLF